MGNPTVDLMQFLEAMATAFQNGATFFIDWYSNLQSEQALVFYLSVGIMLVAILITLTTKDLFVRQTWIILGALLTYIIALDVGNLTREFTFNLAVEFTGAMLTVFLLNQWVLSQRLVFPFIVLSVAFAPFVLNRFAMDELYIGGMRTELLSAFVVVIMTNRHWLVKREQSHRLNSQINSATDEVDDLKRHYNDLRDLKGYYHDALKKMHLEAQDLKLQRKAYDILLKRLRLRQQEELAANPDLTNAAQQTQRASQVQRQKRRIASTAHPRNRARPAESRPDQTTVSAEAIDTEALAEQRPQREKRAKARKARARAERTTQAARQQSQKGFRGTRRPAALGQQGLGDGAITASGVDFHKRATHTNSLTQADREYLAEVQRKLRQKRTTDLLPPSEGGKRLGHHAIHDPRETMD